MKKSVIIELLIWVIILTIIFFCSMKVYSKIFIEKNIYNIEFKDINGITEGSPVRFMGYYVGYVRKLQTKNKYIEAQVMITQKDFKIPNGTVARIEFYGLGGSKSIELMPPDGSCNVGIITEDTIRILDVGKRIKGFVNVLEQLDKYIQNIDTEETKTTFSKIKNINPNNSKITGKNLGNFQNNFNKINENISTKENKALNKIKNINEKINKFINE